MKKSIIAFTVTLALGLLSMGALGFALYYPVAPMLLAWFPSPEHWRGDWVWPAAIGTGMGWSCGFLWAGWLNRWLAARGSTTPRRRAAYVAVLWLWALVIWACTLAAQTF